MTPEQKEIETIYEDGELSLHALNTEQNAGAVHFTKDQM